MDIILELGCSQTFKKALCALNQGAFLATHFWHKYLATSSQNSSQLDQITFVKSDVQCYFYSH